jgi:hypothetical protein
VAHSSVPWALAHHADADADVRAAMLARVAWHLPLVAGQDGHPPVRTTLQVRCTAAR